MSEITSWVKKIWKNRITEFPTRRTLTKEDGSTEIVTVTRNEGTVSEEGDAFDADTMNNLEERIDAGFTELNGKLQWHTIDGGSNVVQDDGLKTATEICVFMSYASVIRMAPAEAFETLDGIGVDVSIDANNLHYSNLSYVKLDRTNGKLTSSFQYGQIYTEPNTFIKVYYR